MKSAIVIPGLCCILAFRCFGQSADDLVQQGRAFLMQKDITNANARFAAAVARDSSHQAAQALNAISRLLVLPSNPAIESFLDRLGLSRTNRSIYHWNPTVPKDTNNVPFAPTAMNAAESVTLLRTVVLPEIAAAEAGLARITSTNFLLGLSQAETTLDSVFVDYGDIQFCRALLCASQYLIYTLHAQNWDAQLAEIRALYTNKTTTVEQVMTRYPHLLTFATTNDLAAAKAAFEQAVDHYFQASAWMRSRDLSLTRLFNLDPDDFAKEERFRLLGADLKNSLSSLVHLNFAREYSVQFSQLFTGRTPYRSFLPRFHENAVVLGTLPDPTFDSTVFGFTRPALEDAIAGKIQSIPRFKRIEKLADGQYQLQLNTLDSRVYGVDRSTDLKQWTRVNNFVSTDGVLSFVEPAAGDPRFYRAMEVKNDRFANRMPLVGSIVTAQGDYEDTSPEPGSPAFPQTTLWWSWTAPFTGEVGISWVNSYEFQLAVYTGSSLDRLNLVYLAGQADQRTFNATAGVTYLIAVARTWMPFSSDEVVIALAPLPVNDQFANRQALTGAPLSILAHNVGATAENGEPGGSRSVWWTWTAPADGSVSLAADSEMGFEVGVYTGVPPSNFQVVASDWEQAQFDAKSGTAYLVRVSSSGYSGVFKLNLSFHPGRYPLAIEVNPEDGGSVDANPGPDDEGFYTIGSKVTVKASAYPALVFHHWEGGASGVNPEASVWVNGTQQVIAHFRPRNDDFANRTMLTGPNPTAEGTIAGATWESNEPELSNVGNGSVWWSWIATQDGYAAVNIIPRSSWSQFSPAVFHGNQLSSLNLDAKANFSGGPLFFPTKVGTRYEIAVAGWNTEWYGKESFFQITLTQTNKPAALP